MPSGPREAEFERLLDEYGRLIVSKIRGIDHEKKGIDRDDLLQAVRIRIWRLCEEGLFSKGSVDNRRSYIARLVHTTVLKELRDEDIRRRTIERWTAGISRDRPDPSERSSRAGEALRDALQSAMRRLPERKATVIRLRLEGFAFAEIARLCGIPEHQARHYFFRGIKTMKASLVRRGVIE